MSLHQIVDSAIAMKNMDGFEVIQNTLGTHLLNNQRSSRFRELIE
jgi:hypothetical protein